MYKLELNKLSKLFNNNFLKITNHHKYGTRQATSSDYFLPQVDKKIAQKQLSFKRSKLWSTSNGIHLRKNIFNSHLTLIEEVVSKLQLLWC